MKYILLYLILLKIRISAELRRIKLNLDDTYIDSNEKIKKQKLENESDLKVGTEIIESKKFFNQAYEQKNLFEGFFKTQKNLKKNFKIYQNRNLVRSRQIEQQFDLNGDYPQIFHIIGENQELDEDKINITTYYDQFKEGIVYRSNLSHTNNFIISKDDLNQIIDQFYVFELNSLLRFKENLDTEKFRNFVMDQKSQKLLRKLLIKRNNINKKQVKKDLSKIDIQNYNNRYQRSLDNQGRNRRRVRRKDNNSQNNKKQQSEEKDKKQQNRRIRTRGGRRKQDDDKKNNEKEKPKRVQRKVDNRRNTKNDKKKTQNDQRAQQKDKETRQKRQRVRKKMTTQNLPEVQDKKKNTKTPVDNTKFAKRRVKTKGLDANQGGYHNVNIIFDKSLMDYHLEALMKQKNLVKKLNFKNVSDQQIKAKVSQYLDNLLQRGNGVLRKYILFKDEKKKQPIKIASSGPKCYSTPLFNPENKRMRGRPKKYDTDVVIFVDIIHKANSPVLAEAAACSKNKENQAEIGQMAINIAKINFQNEDHFSLYTNLMTVVHEVFHIFGFSPTFGVKIRNILKKTDNDYLSKMRKLPGDVEPLIQQEHWEPSLIPNDLMVPQERIDAILSIFSLEYLENISPNIRTNKSNLQDNFLMDEINDYEELFNFKCSDQETKLRPKFSFYCNYQEKRSRNISCDSSYVYKAYCGPKLKNGCYERISMKNEICMNAEQSSKNNYEVYGPDSRCFEVVVKNKQQAFCLKFTIDSNSILVHLKNNQIVTCQRSKNVDSDIEQNQKIQQGDITIYCPNYERFLNSVKMTGCKDFCHGNGFCSNGECDCFDGYDIKDNCYSYLKTHEDMTLFSKFAHIN